jgi:hypothetical protein
VDHLVEDTLEAPCTQNVPLIVTRPVFHPLIWIISPHSVALWHHNSVICYWIKSNCRFQWKSAFGWHQKWKRDLVLCAFVGRRLQLLFHENLCCIRINNWFVQILEARRFIYWVWLQNILGHHFQNCMPGHNLVKLSKCITVARVPWTTTDTDLWRRGLWWIISASQAGIWREQKG